MRNPSAHWRTLLTAGLIIAALWNPGAEAKDPVKQPKERAKVGSAPAVLWRDPLDIKTRDLFYGPGGKEHMPAGKLTFLEEKFNGINPKFDARDEAGIRWGVKFGIEAQPEVAATRLVWAVGYFTQENYYLAELPANRLPNLSRGEAFIKHGSFQRVRLKRHNKGEHEIGNWSWDKNPFAGTKELNGLKVMMELICNTDLKLEHRVIYDIGGVEQHYYLTDLGSSFGKAGLTLNRTKGILKDYQSRPLIRKIHQDSVDFWYFERVPRADAKWIGEYLSRLSDIQINDAFRAAGYSPAEVDGFTKTVRAKISELNNL
ncbi:MAG TPA: hypothetical protein VEU96_15040 [Bryobacteraceae bacterium]|nr:hypothetical protein [Bryobacteraceae bacterium]